jgi:hypothetical protein
VYYDIDIYAGQKIKGIEITPSGMIAGAHLGGIGGLKNFLTSGGDNNPADANGTKIGDYVKMFAGYDTPFKPDLSGNDVLKGGQGEDRLDGKGGNDSLSGKAGGDTYNYVVAVASGNDTILDLGATTDQDILGVYGSGITRSISHLHYSRPTADRDDLRIAILDGKGVEKGSVTIDEMADPTCRVEKLGLYDAVNKLLGQVDLAAKFNELSANAMPLLKSVYASQDVRAGIEKNIAGLWTAQDADAAKGDKIDYWAFYDANAATGSGYLKINGPCWVWNGSVWQPDADGGVQPAQKWISVTSQAFNAGSVKFVGGSSASQTDVLYAEASDGSLWSNMAEMLFT